MQKTIVTRPVNGISELAEKYEGFVLDQWGVIHDGNTPYPGVHEVLTNLRQARKPVVILTNSSKTSAVNERRLSERFHIGRDLYECLVSSAEVTVDVLQLRGYELFGTRSPRAFVVADGTDASIVDNSSLRRVTDAEQADFVLLLSVDPHQDFDSYLHWIEAACFRKTPLVCCSADQLTVTPDGVYGGLSAVTTKYQELGGTVINFGKPEPYCYEICQTAFKGIPPAKVLAIGDQVESDINGAKRFGFDAGLVRTGAAETQFSPALSTTRVLAELEHRRHMGGLVPDWLLPGLSW